MKLYYYKGPTPNFGDDLNPWLWPKLIPSCLDDNEDQIFVGIGTILNHGIPVLPEKIVFGSGYGYGQKPIIDDRWHFLCVRGPLTAKALNLDPKLAITDPAILVRALPLPAFTKKYAISYMPHIGSIRLANWEKICQNAGIHYISPTLDVDAVLENILSSELLLTEALHGAIVAHALRIPWIPILCYRSVLQSKWQDWTLTVDLEYKPTVIHGVQEFYEKLSTRQIVRAYIKSKLLSLGIWKANWHPPISTPRLLEKCSTGLINAAKQEPVLGRDSRLNLLTEQLLEKIELVKRMSGHR